MSWGKQRKVQKFFRSTKKKIIKIDKDGNEIVAKILYKIEFIDSARFMVSSLSNFQILLIILQKEVIKLNVKIVIVFLNMKLFRTI